MTDKKKKPPFHGVICRRLVELHERIQKLTEDLIRQRVLPRQVSDCERDIETSRAEKVVIYSLLHSSHVPISAKLLVTETLVKLGYGGKVLEEQLAAIFSDAENANDDDMA